MCPPTLCFRRTAARAGVTIFSDSQLVDGAATFLWRPPAGERALTFVLSVAARDAGGDSATFTTTLRAERAAVDTESPPALPAASAFLPESTVAWGHQPRRLLAGVGLGVTAALLSALGPQGTSRGDSRAFLVGGALTIAGLAAFVKGGFSARPIAANVAHNHELWGGAAAAWSAAMDTNARRRAGAGVR